MKYNFEEIKQFLKERDLYGQQVFATEGLLSHTLENIYSKDEVTINLFQEDGRVTYLEIFGLTEEDFEVLEDAFLDTWKDKPKYYDILKDSMMVLRQQRLNKLNQNN